MGFEKSPSRRRSSTNLAFGSGWSGRKVATRTKIETQRVSCTTELPTASRSISPTTNTTTASRIACYAPISLHYRVDLAEFSRRDLTGYLRVNDHFARELHEVLEPDDLVWVHDYHLIPLAKALREARACKGIRIGFFPSYPVPAAGNTYCVT